MLNRRELLKLSAAATVATVLPGTSIAADTKANGPFRFCLNTSTISGQNPGLLKAIEMAESNRYMKEELHQWIAAPQLCRLLMSIGDGDHRARSPGPMRLVAVGPQKLDRRRME